MESDIDHISKLSIALMQGPCFINNGLILTRIECNFAFTLTNIIYYLSINQLIN